MADRFGAISLPATAAPAGQPDGDPALFYIGEYLKAYINAKLTTAWQAVAPTQQPIKSVFYDSPSAGGEFNERDLPALYIFRGDTVTDQIAEDWNVESTNVTVQWVFSPMDQAKLSKRRPFSNAVDKAVKVAIERGRDPTYVISGDPDPKAPTFGSDVFGSAYANVVSIDHKGCKPSTLAIRMADGPSRGYPMLEITLDLREVWEQSIEDGTAPHDEQQTTVSVEGLVVADERFHT